MIPSFFMTPYSAENDSPKIRFVPQTFPFVCGLTFAAYTPRWTHFWLFFPLFLDVRKTMKKLGLEAIKKKWAKNTMKKEFQHFASVISSKKKHPSHDMHDQSIQTMTQLISSLKIPASRMESSTWHQRLMIPDLQQIILSSILEISIDLELNLGHNQLIN